MRCLTPRFERQLLTAQWNKQGIYIHYIDGTVSRLARLDALGESDVLDFGDVYPLYTPPFKCFDVSDVGVLAFVGGGWHDVAELEMVLSPSFGQPLIWDHPGALE